MCLIIYVTTVEILNKISVSIVIQLLNFVTIVKLVIIHRERKRFDIDEECVSNFLEST